MTLPLYGLVATPTAKLRLQLTKGETLSFTPVPGLTLTVCHGRAWLTQEGDPSDHVLEGSASFRPSKHGRVVAQGLEDVVIVAEVNR